MLVSRHVAPLTNFFLLGLALSAGCEYGLSSRTHSVAPSSSIWLRNSFDTDPTTYVGRFVREEVTELDESNTMELACSKYITTHFIKGGNTLLTEEFQVSNHVAAKIGVPMVASGSAGYQHQRRVRVNYKLTGKLVAEISDPDAFVACCKKQPDQCTDRFVGEFIQGTGSFSHHTVRDMSAEGQGTNPANGISGEAEGRRSVELDHTVEFPEPVYFAFKVHPTFMQGTVKTCPDWVNRPPRSDVGIYVVGAADKMRNYEEARNAALSSAEQMAKRSLGSETRVQVEEWCIRTMGKRLRYSVRVLGFAPNGVPAAAGSPTSNLRRREDSSPPPDGASTSGEENDFIRIPGGEFDGHYIPEFEMMRTEVTVAQYQSCVEAGACIQPADGSADLLLFDYYNWGKQDRNQHPVNAVTWQDASAYCDWVNARLPTEWEWEWAARGRDEARTYPWGDIQPNGHLLNACGTECISFGKDHLGWSQDVNSLYTDDDGWVGTAPVGNKPRGVSRDGLQDMAGNVAEWTDSSQREWREGNRILRGGHCSTNDAEGVQAESSRAQAFLPSPGMPEVGFRCVRNLSTGPSSLQ